MFNEIRISSNVFLECLYVKKIESIKRYYIKKIEDLNSEIKVSVIIDV